MGIVARKEKQKQEIRSLILEASMKLFVEEGFSKVSVRKIAEGIQYSPTTLYLYFKDKNEFSNIYILGHSQGSLVGLLALDNNVTGFISIAGAGQDIGDVIIDQINNTARQFLGDTKKVVAILKTGQTTNKFPPELAAIFNIETQPFMISWMAYNPSTIIGESKTPTLIINGTKDLQVSVEEATRRLT